VRGPVLRRYRKTSAWLGRYCTRKRIVLFVGVWLMSLFLSSGDAALSRWYSTDSKGAAVSANRPTRKTRPAGGPERQTGDSANGRKKAWRHRGTRYRRNLAIAGHHLSFLHNARRTPFSPGRVPKTTCTLYLDSLRGVGRYPSRVLAIKRHTVPSVPRAGHASVAARRTNSRRRRTILYPWSIVRAMYARPFLVAIFLSSD
jgi:hypothetical protein